MSMVERHPVDLSKAIQTSPKEMRSNVPRGQQSAPLTSQLVVLVHGLGAPRFSMSAVKWKLDKAGYRTKNWGYSSTRDRIASHADLLSDMLHSFSEDRSLTSIHLVTHSMGGILVRAALLKHTFAKLGRIVMLAPPNRGSHAARLAAPIFGWLWKPLRELSDAPESYVNQLPIFSGCKTVELGIIEAQRDRVVSADSVRLAGQVDHAVVNSRHGTLPWHPETLQLVSGFLTHGKFNEQCDCPVGLHDAKSPPLQISHPSF